MKNTRAFFLIILIAPSMCYGMEFLLPIGIGFIYGNVFEYLINRRPNPPRGTHHRQEQANSHHPIADSSHARPAAVPLEDPTTIIEPSGSKLEEIRTSTEVAEFYETCKNTAIPDATATIKTALFHGTEAIDKFVTIRALSASLQAPIVAVNVPSLLFNDMPPDAIFHLAKIVLTLAATADSHRAIVVFNHIDALLAQQTPDASPKLMAKQQRIRDMFATFLHLIRTPDDGPTAQVGKMVIVLGTADINGLLLNDIFVVPGLLFHVVMVC